MYYVTSFPPFLIILIYSEPVKAITWEQIKSSISHQIYSLDAIPIVYFIIHYCFPINLEIYEDTKLFCSSSTETHFPY